MKPVNCDTGWLKFLSFLGVVLLTPGLSLFADEQSELFAKLDKNSDGVLESQELNAAQKSIFTRLLREGDTNKDGKISLQEFKQATNPQPKQPLESQLGGKQNQRGPAGKGNFDVERVFGFLDTNKDGKLTRKELPERAKERFEKMFDKLGKDEISKTEFLAAARKFRPQPGQKPGKFGKDQAGDFFKRFDKNKDGKVILSEVPEQLRPRIMRIFKQSGKSPQEGITQADLKKIAGQRPGGKFRPQKKKPEKKT